MDHPHIENDWYCTSSNVERTPEIVEVKDTVDIVGHNYVDDCKDGGLVPLFLDRSNLTSDQPLIAPSRGDKMTPADVFEAAERSFNHKSPPADVKLPIKCHCGGVSLLLDRSKAANKSDPCPEYAITTDPAKYRARPCMCTSCRLATGLPMQHWTYVPLAAVKNMHTGNPVVLWKEAEKGDPYINEGLALKFYSSTDQAQRSFCGVCGATVFYYTIDESRKDIVDVAVGLLRAESGSMAREWLEWVEGDLSYGEEALDQTVKDLVKQGWRR